MATVVFSSRIDTRGAWSKCIWPTKMEAAGTLTLEKDFHDSYSLIISSEGRSELVFMRLSYQVMDFTYKSEDLSVFTRLWIWSLHERLL